MTPEILKQYLEQSEKENPHTVTNEEVTDMDENSKSQEVLEDVDIDDADDVDDDIEDEADDEEDIIE